MKILINVPMVVDADVRSYDDSEECAFNLSKTDVLEITNIKAPEVLKISSQNIVVLE